ncbi:MAG: transposase [Proteobacteria bacterium]|nr:transposase [Pseudomonadota bacterium]
MINFASYFELPNSDEEIARTIEVSPSPIIDIAKYEVEEAIKLLERAFKESYVATAQGISLIRRIVGIGRGHLRSAYPDESTYKKRCHCFDLRPATPWDAVALVGLGGTGKTQLIRAIQRLLDPKGATVSVDGLPMYAIQPLIVMTMAQGTTLTKLLTPFAGSASNADTVQIQAAKNAYTQGTGLAILDESQFVTSTQGGHAKSAKTLMQATYIGPPLLYCANYSLIQKLGKRPNQERDRLLSNVIAIVPEAKGSKGFADILDAQLRVFGDATSHEGAVKAERYADEIHNYVFGISRKSATLLQWAWRFARWEGDKTLRFSHIKKAYESECFTSHRKEVEILKQQVFQKKKIRDDLWCDYVPMEPSNVVYVQEFENERNKRIAAELSRSTMSPEDREAYDALSKQESDTGDKKSRVVRFGKADKSLSGLQSAGAALLDQYRGE